MAFKISTRYIQFNVQDWVGKDISMRVELYGCEGRIHLRVFKTITVTPEKDDGPYNGVLFEWFFKQTIEVIRRVSETSGLITSRLNV